MKHLILITILFTIFSCADPNGLHNQEAAQVTFVFENIPTIDGGYSLPGDYQVSEWDNTNIDLDIKSEAGSSKIVTITKSTIEFSLVPVESWDRPWYPIMKSNHYDYGSGGKQWNFQVIGLPLGQDVTIKIDGSSTPASVIIE